jgi:hypothetical protein
MSTFCDVAVDSDAPLELALAVEIVVCPFFAARSSSAAFIATVVPDSPTALVSILVSMPLVSFETPRHAFITDCQLE